MFKFGNIASMMSGMQKLPEAMVEMTERLRGEVIEVSAGEGAVVARFNGVGEMQMILFDSDSQPSEQLQIWVLQACNQGQDQAKQMYADAMQALASDLNLGGLPGMDNAMAALTGGR